MTEGASVIDTLSCAQASAAWVSAGMSQQLSKRARSPGGSSVGTASRANVLTVMPGSAYEGSAS